MSEVGKSRTDSLRYSQILASARLVERCLEVVTETEFQERWNFGPVKQSHQFALAWCASMEGEGADHEMTEGKEQTGYPWNTLETVTTFDQGTSNDTNSMIRINNKNENQNNGKVASQTGQQVAQATGVLIESLIQQLCAMVVGDKVSRNKLFNDICSKLYELQLINDTYNIAEFDALRGKYQLAFSRMLRLAQSQPENEIVLSIPRLLQVIPKLFRYYEEFREICFIARGGFGEVYKALHRLDDIEYAIKKIIIPVDRVEILQQQMNEVRTLAKLKHPNIVSYNAAWIEPLPYTSNASSLNRKSSKRNPNDSKLSSPVIITDLSENDLNLTKSKVHHDKQDMLLDAEASCTTDTHIKTKKHNKVNGKNDASINKDTISIRFEEFDSSDNVEEKIVEESNIEEYKTEESSSDVVSFRNSKSNENLDETTVGTDTDNDSSKESTRNSKSNENLDQTTVDTSNDTSNDSCEESTRDSVGQEVCTYTSNKNQMYSILYIQMALCEQTLEQWLRGKINVTPEPMVIAIFQQILCGVDYMHSQKVVHHDIKPSNIFISTSGQLQIQLGDFGLACPLQKENHHSAIGTHVYAAPEQLQGKCDSKSDIYSIGIVLIELLLSIKTRMELASIINSLKSGEIPEALKQHKWAQMVKKMVQEDPANRPSTSQLLQDFNHDKDVTINKLKNTIVDLKNDHRIKIEKLQQEIRLLKEKIQELSLGNTIN